MNFYLFTEIININQVTIIYTVVEYKTKFNHTILTRARQAWLLFNTKWAIFKLYRDGNKWIFWWNDDVCFVL